MAEPKSGWKRRCGACGSERVAGKQGLFHCLDCKRSEAEDPWNQCPCCGGQVMQTKVFRVGSYMTGDRKCVDCDYRLTFESRVVHQRTSGEKQPGPWKWMTQLMGRIKTESEL